MSLSIGIVGLPNAGKSTLFNALLKRQIADVGEYPFTTVEPNTGVVEVKDARLEKLAEVLGIGKQVPAAIKFYDIAGLVKGAHEGEGLGNQFLGHIRQVDAILHLVRGFSNKDVAHVAGQVDPVHDLNTVNLELALADFETVSRVLEEEKKKGKEKRLEVLGKVKQVLEEGEMARETELDEEEERLVRDLNLLTMKPMLYGLNLDEAAIKGAVGWEKVVSEAEAKKLPPVLLISAKLEAEINELEEGERKEYLTELGLAEPLLDRLIKACFKLLGLISFFTIKGGKQAQAWPLEEGRSVWQAAEMIHTDLAEGFVKAEVVDWKELVSLGGWTKAKEAGKLKLVGKEHQVKDGEVVEIITSK